MKTLLLISFISISFFLQAQSWVSIGDLPIEGRYDDIVFSDEMNGWCVNSGGDIYHTADGGTSWVLQYENAQYMRAIEFIDNQVGIAGSLDGNHLKTTNGGNTWTAIPDVFPGPVPGLCGLSHAGQHFFGVGAYYNPAYFIHSPDAGETWEWMDMSAHADGLVGCHFLNENVGLVGGIIESEGAVILKTTDGGDTWTEVFSTTGGTEYIWKFFAVSDQVIYASIESWIIPGTFIAKSTDGGDTWQQYQVSDQVLDIQGIGFEDELHGWVGPRSHPLFETSDGGLTWAEGTGPNNVNRIFQTEAGTLFASGSTIHTYDESTYLIESLPTELAKLSLDPNPVDHTVNVSIELFQSSVILLGIYDMNGRGVLPIQHVRFAAGKYSFIQDVTGLASGEYHLSLRTNEGFQSLKFLKQ